jgi:hypothetical protein
MQTKGRVCVYSVGGVLEEPVDIGALSGGRDLVVHLGNVGYGLGREVPAQKTAQYAKRFPDFMFVGIDLRAYKGRGYDNWVQIKGNFKEGLELLRDNSVALISSDLAFGHYDSKGRDPMDVTGGNAIGADRRAHNNTVDAAKVAFRKLREGGKMTISVGSRAEKTVTNVLEESGFNKDKIRVRKLSGREYGRTFWTYHYQEFGAVYQITAEK